MNPQGNQYVPPKLQANQVLQMRLNSLAAVDTRIGHMMKCAHHVIGELSRERQTTRAKTEDSVQEFKRCLNFIESTMLRELNYLETFCASSNHQGSAFMAKENGSAVDDINTMLLERIDRVSRTHFEEEPKTVEENQESPEEEEKQDSPDEEEDQESPEEEENQESPDEEENQESPDEEENQESPDEEENQESPDEEEKQESPKEKVYEVDDMIL